MRAGHLCLCIENNLSNRNYRKSPALQMAALKTIDFCTIFEIYFLKSVDDEIVDKYFFRTNGSLFAIIRTLIDSLSIDLHLNNNKTINLNF